LAKFKSGQSGNPRGKLPGTKHASTRLRDAISTDLHAIVAALVEKAKAGDTGAAALLFSRTLPPLRPQSDPPDVSLVGTTLNERAESITGAALAGQISPTGATELMGLLTQQARIHEVSELAERLERIENALKLEGKSK
jgi:hypothetical protein